MGIYTDIPPVATPLVRVPHLTSNSERTICHRDEKCVDNFLPRLEACVAGKSFVRVRGKQLGATGRGITGK